MMPPALRRALTRSLSLSLGIGALLAATAPALAEDWQPAPLYGGDVRSLAVVPGEPDLLLAGTSAGQVYRSTSGGSSWENAGAPLPFPGWVVNRLVFDPDRSLRLWVALWGVWGSGQVAYSDDLGKTWSARSTGLPNEPVYTLAAVPGRPGRLYAGTLSGVYGTEDDGAHWRSLTADLPAIQKVTSLLVDPAQPETVIAGTWRQAYRSDDGGRTWAGVFQGMVLDTEVFSLTPVAQHPGEIWASTCGWVYQTVDHGTTWTRFKNGLDERRTPSFAALPDGRLLAGTVAGLYASADAGATWARLSDAALSILSLAVDPARPERIVLGTEGSGIWRSDDGGKTFLNTSRGMTNLRVAALAAVGDDLLVAVNHAGPLSGVHVSHDRGRTIDGLFSPLPTLLGLAVHEGRPYAATERGLYVRLGSDWHRVPELGESRIEQILSDGDTLVARTAEKLYELRREPPPAERRGKSKAAAPEAPVERFVERGWKHGTPRTAALFPAALWVADDQGLYRLTANDNHTISTPGPGPVPGAKLERLADRLLYWGSGGAWTRLEGLDSPWVALPAKPLRAFATGDGRYPALLVLAGATGQGESAALYDRQTQELRPVDLPVPSRDVTSALWLDGRLLVGTSGYGVLASRME